MGAFCGGFAALVVAFPLAYFGAIPFALSSASLAGVVAGALAGAVLPETVLYAAQAVLYFVLGLFTAMAGGEVEPPKSSPKWIWGAFLFGVAYVIFLWAL